MTQQASRPGSGHRGIDVEGAFNVRDLGGLRSATGGAVRRGLLYRSGDLGRLTPAGAAQLRALGVVTVIDLRTSAELERRGVHPFEGHGIAHRHEPLLQSSAAEPETASPAELPPDALAGLSRHIATAGSAGVGRVLTALAREDTLPAVVHCVAGKDRTGVVVALVLALLGVPDDEIVADYILSEAALTALRANAHGHHAELAAWMDRVPPPLLRARPEAMHDFLAWMRTEHGSPEGYAGTAGVTGADVEALRTRLLDRA